MQEQDKRDKEGKITGTIITKGGGHAIGPNMTEQAYGGSTYALQLVSSYRQKKSMRWVNLYLNNDPVYHDSPVPGNDIKIDSGNENLAPQYQTFSPILLDPGAVFELVFTIKFPVNIDTPKDELDKRYWFINNGQEARIKYLDENNEEKWIIVPIKRQ